MARRIIPAGTKARALELLKTGMKPAEVAAEVGCNATTVRDWMHAAKMRTTERGGPVDTQREDSPAPVVVSAPRIVTSPPAPVASAPLPPLPPSAPVAVPPAGTPAMEISLEELAEIQRLMQEAGEYRRDVVKGQALRLGLNAEHPAIKELGEPNRLAKLALKRGCETIAPMLAKVPPWGWLTLGLLAETISMTVAFIQLRAMANEVAEKRAKHPENQAAPKKADEDGA